MLFAHISELTREVEIGAQPERDGLLDIGRVPSVPIVGLFETFEVGIVGSVPRDVQLLPLEFKFALPVELGKGQMGSALMRSLQISCFV